MNSRYSRPNILLHRLIDHSEIKGRQHYSKHLDDAS